MTGLRETDASEPPASSCSRDAGIAAYSGPYALKPRGQAGRRARQELTGESGPAYWRVLPEAKGGPPGDCETGSRSAGKRRAWAWPHVHIAARQHRPFNIARSLVRAVQTNRSSFTAIQSREATLKSRTSTLRSRHRPLQSRDPALRNRLPETRFRQSTIRFRKAAIQSHETTRKFPVPAKALPVPHRGNEAASL
jgi:hypothetical protein